jgi:peptidoglycan/xylan/chitin deacetylase (PgdA/CDA1 family)
MLISHKRAFLADLLRRSGTLQLLDLAARRPGLLVLGYHRIGQLDQNPFYDSVFSATPEAFREQVTLLREHFRMLSLDDVIAAAPDFAFREPSALITFDDGYRDNLNLALPVLVELGVPAAFFLPTDFLDHPHLFWWDKLAYLLKRNPIEPLANQVAACLASHPDAIADHIDRIAECAGITVPEADLARSLLIDWDGARALVAAGMDVGSHGRSHRNLGRLDEPSQRDELARSRATLESNLGRDVAAIAYPYGTADAFSDLTCKIASEVGYRVGFSFGGGINRPGATPTYAIARINVGFSDTPNLLRARVSMLSALGRSLV